MIFSNDATALILTPVVYKLRIGKCASRLGSSAARIRGREIFGCDLGTNITTVGSLATVLWLLILRQRDVDVSRIHFSLGAG